MIIDILFILFIIMIDFFLMIIDILFIILIDFFLMIIEILLKPYKFCLISKYHIYSLNIY